MSVSRVQIDAELHTAERALEAATERRRAAEHALWEAVGKSGKKNVPAQLVEDARAELAEAERVRVETEALVVSLRKQLQLAQERETRLLAITDMLLAREEARRAEAAQGKGNGHPRPSPGGRRSFLDRFRRH